jgi:hypothetical protein
MGGTKSLYDVLEIPRSASKEAIQAAYSALSERVKVRAVRDPDGAAAYAAALAEAHKVLSDPELKRNYDARLAAANQPKVVVSDDRPWIRRHAVPIVLVLMIAGGWYWYHVQQVKKQEAVAAALREAEELLAKQKAEKEETERLEAEKQEARRKMIEQVNYQRWSEQARRDAAINHQRQESMRLQAERQAAYEIERERRLEQISKQREETQARMRLEQEKRRLQQLEYQNNRR